MLRSLSVWQKPKDCNAAFKSCQENSEKTAETFELVPRRLNAAQVEQRRLGHAAYLYLCVTATSPNCRGSHVCVWCPHGAPSVYAEFDERFIILDERLKVKSRKQEAVV